MRTSRLFPLDSFSRILLVNDRLDIANGMQHAETVDNPTAHQQSRPSLSVINEVMEVQHS
jgi:hypothetical protein